LSLLMHGSLADPAIPTHHERCEHTLSHTSKNMIEWIHLS
jgi:hypothetical protein